MNWLQRLGYPRAVLGIMHGSRAFGGPLQVSIGLTNRCNIRCLHCYYYSPSVERPNLVQVRRARQAGADLPDDPEVRRLQSLQMPAERALSLIDEAVECGTGRILFTGAGEPFMHPKILDLVERAKAAACYCLVNTNGTLLSREVIDALVTLGCDRLMVNVLAGTPEGYARTHPGSAPGVFERLRDSLARLADRKETAGRRRPTVALVHIVCGPNSDGLPDFAEFAGAVRADEVVFRPLDAVGDAGLTGLLPTADQAARVRDVLPTVGRRLRSSGIKHNARSFLHVFNRKLDTRAIYRRTPCYAGWVMALVATDGLVYPCCRCYKPLGDVSIQALRDVWHGEHYTQFRREAIGLRRRGEPVTGCTCWSCAQFGANMRIHRLLHPIRSRLGTLRGIGARDFEE